jgi:hypothetical protein
VHKKSLHIVSPFLCLAAALVAGCASGGGSAETSLTKKQFVAKASSICQEAEQEEIKLIGSFSKSHPDAKNEEELVEPAFIPPAEKMIRELGTLGAPSGDENEVKAIVEELENGLSETKKEPKALLNPNTNPFKEADKLAREYGIKACSYVP